MNHNLPPHISNPPSAQGPKRGKRDSKTLTEWIRIARSLGYNQTVVDPRTGKKTIKNAVKKGTPAYDEVMREYQKVKAKGY